MEEMIWLRGGVGDCGRVEGIWKLLLYRRRLWSAYSLFGGVPFRRDFEMRAP